MRPTSGEALREFGRTPGVLATPLTLAALLALAACGSSSMGSMSGTNPAADGTPPGTGKSGNPDPIATGGSVSGSQNAIVATASSGPISVAAGASRTITVTFTSSDGNPISGFGVTTALAGLPAGWSAPADFTCAAVDFGSNCVLDLTYAPAAPGTGTLTLDCVYVDNASMPTTPGMCLTLDYSATVTNNVVAAAAPAGQVNAAIGGGARSVSVNFVTDDGNAATNLAVTTDLTALPAGWSSAVPALACAIVSTGSGCRLMLQFLPTASTGGTLTLAYGYDDASGAAKTGTLNIPYSTLARGTVAASVAPSGEVIAIQKAGSQAVAVTFTTDDGRAASDLFLTSSLVGMPAGWSSASKTFTCATIGSGNGCQLALRYAPAALGGGTLALRYAYKDSSGDPRTGLLNVAYAATTDDNVVATAAPSGRINAIVGAGAQNLSVTFTTDDARTATALALTTGLADLPAGWSASSGTFACSAVAAGSACELDLQFTPTAAASGVLPLSYTYLNNAGAPRTGSLDVDYLATTDDNAVATANPTSLAVSAGSSTPVTVVFTTDDGNAAGNLTVTSGLSSLPAGWSGPATFACASFATGNACQVSLTYAPPAADGGTLTIGYSYVNDSGAAKTGTVSISYLSAP